MERVIAIIQARMGSSRLPRKVALDIYGKPLLERVISQTQRAACVEAVAVATSLEPDDRVIELVCQRLGVICFRGALHDVRSRFIALGEQQDASIIVRVTADNPLTEPQYIDQIVSRMYGDPTVRYCVMNKAQVPDGCYAEVFRYEALREAAALDHSDYSKEHVTPALIKQNQVYTVEPDEEYRLGDLFLGVDTFEDYVRINEIFARYKGCDDLLRRLIADVKRERNLRHAVQPAGQLQGGR